jgi:hypothetical protein
MCTIAWPIQAQPSLELKTQPSGLYYKHVMIVNDDSSIASK